MNNKYKIIDELLSLSTEINSIVSGGRNKFYTGSNAINFLGDELPQEVFDMQLDYVIKRLKIMSNFYNINILSLAESQITMQISLLNTNSVRLRLLELSKSIVKVAENINKMY